MSITDANDERVLEMALFGRSQELHTSIGVFTYPKNTMESTHLFESNSDYYGYFA